MLEPVQGHLTSLENFEFCFILKVFNIYRCSVFSSSEKKILGHCVLQKQNYQKLFAAIQELHDKFEELYEGTIY